VRDKTTFRLPNFSHFYLPDSSSKTTSIHNAASAGIKWTQSIIYVVTFYAAAWHSGLYMKIASYLN
jgi:hypothetical protein